MRTPALTDACRISEGDQILVNYGDSYWKATGQALQVEHADCALRLQGRGDLLRAALREAGVDQAVLDDVDNVEVDLDEVEFYTP